MRRFALLCAVAVVFCSAAAAGQSPPSQSLSAPLRARLQDQFAVITSVRGLPLGVREELQTMWKSSTLDIAEPGTEFQKAGAAADSNLPLRRLIAAGCTTDNYCLVYYERGGKTPTWHVALFHWSPDGTRFEWGSTAPGNLKTVDDVRKAILSGVISGQAGPW